MLTGLTSGCQKNDPAANAQSPPPLPVKLQKIGTGTIEESSEFVGSLEAQQKVTLQSQTQGRIESILVSSGQRVQQGTPIASLSLDQAQANVASSIAAASSAQAEQQQAEAQRTKAAANVQMQRTQFNRTQQLVSQGAVARQESDIARNNLQSAIADLQAAENQVAASGAAVRHRQISAKLKQARLRHKSTSVSSKW